MDFTYYSYVDGPVPVEQQATNQRQTMSTAATSKRSARSTTASDAPQDDDDGCSQMMIHDLPNGILQNILGYLPLTSRAHLSSSGNKLLYDLVQSFNHNLITSHSPSSSSQDALFNAQREELINIIEKRKWLPKDNDDSETILHRLTKGDHLATPDQVIFNTHGWDSDEYKSDKKYKRKFKRVDHTSVYGIFHINLPRRDGKHLH